MEILVQKATKFVFPKVNKAKKVLITSALPYVNNVPHLGNVIGCVLSADIFARFKRSMGYEVLYICGTDEYGTTSEVKALEQGVTPKQLCDKYHTLHHNAYKWLDISFDHFGRTSNPSHTKITQSIFTDLDQNGYIKPIKHSQHFCTKCDLYLSDRYVKGGCPQCGKETKGDQCDSCGKVVEALEIINPKCVICGSDPILKHAEHLNLDLATIQPKLREWMDQRKYNWSQKAQGIANGWMKLGLKPRSISRNLKWGIPIPKPGFEHMVFFVWFDAPIGYISMTEELLGEKYKQWWMSSENTDLYQFMGKDNVPFHALMFPSSLLGTHKPYTTVTHICSTEYLMYEGQKFSKSKKIGIFCDELPSIGIESSVWRYYLIAIRPQNSDSNFEWDEFAHRTNSELLGNIGNLFNRILGFNFSKMKNKKLVLILSEKQIKFLKQAFELFNSYIALMESVSIKAGLVKANQLSSLANKYMQDNKPWQKDKIASGQSASTIALLLCYLKFLLSVLQPFIPSFCRKASEFMSLHGNGGPRLSEYLGTFEDFCNAFEKNQSNNTEFSKPVPIIRQISNEDKLKMKAQFTPKI